MDYLKPFTDERIDAPPLSEWVNLYPQFKTRCIYQVLHDSDKTKRGRIVPDKIMLLCRSSTSKEKYELLDLRNKQGYWCYFSYNWMGEDDPIERRNDYVTEIIAWVAEIDDLPKEEQFELVNKLHCQPSMIVESKRSLHLYRFCDTTATKDNWLRISQNITAKIGGDIKAPKLAGLFRIPGFYHSKDPASPFLVKCLYIDTGLIYSETEMLTEFPDTAENKRKFWFQNKNSFAMYDCPPKDNHLKELMKKRIVRKNVREELSELDNIMMLELLSWSSLVNWETFSFKATSWGSKQIRVNGKATSSRIDREGKIGSSDKWWPTWLQWLKWYGNSYKDILRYIKKNYSYLLSN